MHTIDIAPLRIKSFHFNFISFQFCRSTQVWHVFSRDFTVLLAHPYTFIGNRNKPYLPLPSQLQPVLIYRPRMDGRLSRPWCEVAQAEIRTCNLPIANPALYHTSTSAHHDDVENWWLRVKKALDADGHHPTDLWMMNRRMWMKSNTWHQQQVSLYTPWFKKKQDISTLADVNRFSIFFAPSDSAVNLLSGND